MKSKKLNLNKFKIAELNNPSKIIGGTGDETTGNETIIGNQKPKCRQDSEIYV